MTAALYCLRAGKKTILLEKAAFGGQIADSPLVENIPSIKSISGNEYAALLFDQISELGVDFDMDDVRAVSREDDHFTVQGQYGTYESKTVIIANGCRHRKLAIPGEDIYLGKGVSYCAVCDGAFYQGRDVIVIGDGNSAISYARSLSDICSSVTVATLFDRFYGEENAAKALLNKKNVKVIHNVSASAFLGDEELRKVRFKSKDGNEFDLDASGCFIAIGHIPDNQRFEGLVRLDGNGFILVDENMMAATEGVYAAGDTRAKKIRQVTTAEGDGAVAALSAIDYLNRLEAA